MTEMALEEGWQSMLVTISTLKSNTESILVSFSSPNVLFFLLVVYRPPNEQQSMSIPTLLDEVCKIVGPNKFLICGDFNMPQIDWTNSIA